MKVTAALIEAGIRSARWRGSGSVGDCGRERENSPIAATSVARRTCSLNIYAIIAVTQFRMEAPKRECRIIYFDLSALGFLILPARVRILWWDISTFSHRSQEIILTIGVISFYLLYFLIEVRSPVFCTAVLQCIILRVIGFCFTPRSGMALQERSLPVWRSANISRKYFICNIRWYRLQHADPLRKVTILASFFYPVYFCIGTIHSLTSEILLYITTAGSALLLLGAPFCQYIPFSCSTFPPGYVSSYYCFNFKLAGKITDVRAGFV